VQHAANRLNLPEFARKTPVAASKGDLIRIRKRRRTTSKLDFGRLRRYELIVHT